MAGNRVVFYAVSCQHNAFPLLRRKGRFISNIVARRQQQEIVICRRVAMEIGDKLIGYVQGEFRIGTVSRVMKNRAFRVECEGKEMSGKNVFCETIEAAIASAAWYITRRGVQAAYNTPSEHIVGACDMCDEVKQLAIAALRFGECR